MTGSAPRSGLDPRRTVQVVTSLERAEGRRGSGYLVTGRAVLTAAHVVRDAATVAVRFLDEHGDPTVLRGEVAFTHHALDIAVIRLHEDPPAADASDIRPARYGRLGPPAACEALGFPRFKLRSVRLPGGGTTEYRDTRHARGTVAPLSALREGILEVLVDPPEYDPDPEHSPWEGMSGAAVWCHGRLVGVITEHRREDGLGTLTATRVDRWHRTLTPEQVRTLHGLIGLPKRPQQLDAVTELSGRFDAYLEAVARAVGDHPYPGVTPGTARPRLTDVHVPQRIRRLGPDPTGTAKPLAAPSELSGDDLPTLGHHCVLLGGPGGGKTSLLRAAVAASVSRWQELREDVSLPVLVNAAELTGGLPFPEALAQSATTELRRFGLLDRLPPEFFRDRPHPGAPWLVLVDGLDEITSPDTRRELLEMIRQLTKRFSATYRFAVATRPLPEWELEAMGQDVRRYELQPFDPDQLDRFTRRWFDAVDTEVPAHAAKSFRTALELARMTDLARTPLMATMLAQLYAAAPDRGLPTGRSAIYARFTEQLHERQRAAGVSGIQAQTRAALERYGPAVLAQAQRTLDELPALIARLAAERLAGHPATATALLADQPAGRRPEPVPGAVWDEFLRDTLRRSGFLVERGAEFVFPHQTVLEYLAAHHVASGPPRDHAKALRRLLTDWRKRARRAPFAVIIHERDSYCGFLLDAGDGAVDGRARILRALARGRGIEGCEILARLVQLGTPVPDDIVERAADRLLGRTGRDDFYYRNERIRAAVALSNLRDERAATVLAQIAEDTRTADALQHLAEDGGETTRKLVYTIRLMNGLGRIQAAQKLGEQGDDRGSDLLLAMVRNSRLPIIVRVQAAGALADLGHPQAGAILHLMSVDPRTPGAARAVAARQLAMKLGDRRGTTTLLALARNDRNDHMTRVHAARGLALVGESRGFSLLVTLSRQVARPTDPVFDVYYRVRAARALATLGDARAGKILAKMAVDPDLPRPMRRRAAVALDAFKRAPGGVSGLELARTEEEQLDASYPSLRFLGPVFRLQNRLLVPFVSRR